MEDDDDSSVSTVTTASSTTSSKKKKQKRKGAKKKMETHDVATQILVSEYEEYEEDDTGVGVADYAQKNVFLEKIERLKELLVLLKPKPEPKSKSKKKKKGRKMSKTEKGSGKPSSERPSTSVIVVTAAELEQDKNKLIKDLQDEIELETYNSEQRLELEAEEMRQRQLQLEKTLHRVLERRRAFVDYALRCLEEEEWLRYMSCDGLPDPAALPELNTYLYLWSLEDAAASMKTLPRQCEVAIYLIRKMDEIIEFSLQAADMYIKDCRQIRQKFRDKLQCWIDMASYCLLRHIERDTIRVDLKNAKYVQQLAPLVCCFWALIRLPISMKQVSEKDRKSVEVDFKEVGLTITMPVDLDCYATAIRILWLGYDHHSDTAATFAIPVLPEEYRMDMDLQKFCQMELDSLNEIRDEQRDARLQRLEEKRSMIRRILNPPTSASAPSKHERKGKKSQAKARAAAAAAAAAAADAEPEPETAPLPLLASPEEMVMQREDEMRRDTRELLFTRTRKTDVNLRKYAILGGLYRVDLIRQPPQPKDMRRDIFLTTLQLPKELEFVGFYRPYKAPPPAPDAERTPEVIEAEMKALEAAMEKLALVTIKLPDTILWFEPPLVVHWLPDECRWTSEEVHDIKYNEEQQSVTFRTGRLGILGLASNRHVNLPFQSWEMRPETGKHSDGGVVLSITGAIIQVEFLVRQDLVSLHSIIGGTSTSLQGLIGKFMKLHILILKMRAAGCDVFPEVDAASYVKGLAQKHPVAGKHLQGCMGLLCTAYMFSWSRWNATRGPREIAMQIKEIHGSIAKERSNAILLVTPFRTMIVNCSEVSPEFCDEPADQHNNFYADLYHYALHNAGIKSRLCMKDVSFKLSTTVSNLLEATNIINMCA